MKTASGFFLVAVLSASSPAHAQCSGGSDGGIDATGNMCGTYEAIETPAQLAGQMAAHLNKARGRPALRAAAPAARPTKMSTEPASRMMPTAMRTSAPAKAPLKNAKVENWSESSCSGGAGGGMDVNGNQCGVSAP